MRKRWEGPMSVTQKDIAKALHISLITVNRALNNSGYVSNELKQRIINYAREVNYVPQRASQTLVRNRTRKIDIFSSVRPSYFWDDIGTGIAIAAEQIRPFRYEVQYHRIPNRNTRAYLAQLERQITEGTEAVAFVNQWSFDMEAVIDHIERARLPYITLNIDAPGSRRLCYIGPDYRAGGRLAAEFIGKSLMFCRRPRVLVITSRPKLRSGRNTPDIYRLREEGFLSVMNSRFQGTDVDLRYLPTGLGKRSAREELRSLVVNRETVDAIYLIAAYNSEFLPLLDELGSERTISVVHDLDSLSNHYLSAHLLTALIYQNPILQGYYTVKILERILEEGGATAVSSVDIEHAIVLEENKKLYRNHYLYAGMIQ